MIKKIVNASEWELAFIRRIDENWIVFKKQKKNKREGLYPSTIIPKHHLGKIVMVIPNADEVIAFAGETVKGFKTKVTEKWIIPQKSRSYYTESKWIENDESPTTAYPCIIVSKKLIGKTVYIIPIIEK